MKIVKLLAAGLLSVSLANAQDVMQKSMSMMEEGMAQIQQGFLNNNVKLREPLKTPFRTSNFLFS